MTVAMIVPKTATVARLSDSESRDVAGTLSEWNEELSQSRKLLREGGQAAPPVHEHKARGARGLTQAEDACAEHTTQDRSSD